MCRWKERLKKAHDAVTETKRSFDDLRERYDKQAERIAELETENANLRDDLAQAETNRTKLVKENVKLQQAAVAHDFEMQRVNKVDSEKLVQDEQIHVLTSNVAEMKTNFEMQELKYQNVVKEHGRFKAEIRHLKSQLKEYHEERAGLSPRPEWKRITQFVAPLTQLPTTGPSAKVARRIVADLAHALFMHRFAVLGVEDGFGHSEVSPAFNGTIESPESSLAAQTLEIFDSAPDTGPEVLMPPALDRRPHSNDGLSEAHNSLESTAASHPESHEGLSSPRHGKTKHQSHEHELVKLCPGLGQSHDVPVHLRSESAVPIATLKTELATIMRDFWNFRIECNIQKAETSEQSMSDAFLAFLQQNLPSEQAALEASYSISVALTDAAKHDAEANLFLLCLLGRVDENCVHVHREIVESCRQWTGHVESFIVHLAFKHPWIHLFADRIRHIATVMEARGSNVSHASAVLSRITSRRSSSAGLERREVRAMNRERPEARLLAEETRDHLVQVVLDLHVVNRRRLMQRFR